MDFHELSGHPCGITHKLLNEVFYSSGVLTCKLMNEVFYSSWSIDVLHAVKVKANALRNFMAFIFF